MTREQRPSGYTYTQPSDWKRTRARILKRDRHVCHVCHTSGANEVDHIRPVAEGGSHDDTNLAAIHANPCHADKSAAERQRGIARRARRRTPRPNPNLID